VRGGERRVVEDGGPAAGDGAEAEEEEGRDAGEHLQEQVVGEPRPDAGVHRDVRVEEERGRGAGRAGGEELGERRRRRGDLVEAPRFGAADRLGRTRRARGPRRPRRGVHGRRGIGAGIEGKSGRILKRAAAPLFGRSRRPLTLAGGEERSWEGSEERARLRSVGSGSFRRFGSGSLLTNP
jgi:hypothetical protein